MKKKTTTENFFYYFHIILATSIVIQILIAEIMGHQGVLKNTHIVLGFIITILTFILWGFIILSIHPNVTFKQYFPYTKYGIQCVIKDIKFLFKFQLPNSTNNPGLIGFAQGIFLIFLTITLIFGILSVANHLNHWGIHGLGDIHTVFAYILIFIVVLHTIFGVLHLIFQNDKFKLINRS